MATDITTQNMWGEEVEGQEDQSFLMGGQEYAYPRPVWFTGVKVSIIVGGKAKAKAKGFWYEIAKMPADFLAAMKILQERGEAQFSTIRHGDGQEKDYCTVLHPRYFVLSHGTPARTAILRDPSKQVGLATGTWTVYKQKETPPQTDTGSFLSVLAVVDQLYRAGYVDEQGAPKAVNLHMKGISSNEFYRCLETHYKLMLKAKNDLGFTVRQAQYWAFYQEIDASEEEVTHGTGTDSQDVFYIESKHPEVGEWTREYLEAIQADEVLFAQMFPLVYDMETTPRRPGGAAIEWCRESIQRGLENQKEFTSPTGKGLAFGKKEAPAWLVNRDRIEEAGTYSEQAIRGGAAKPAAGAVIASPLDAIKETLSAQRRWFNLQIANDDGEDAERLETLTTTLALIAKALRQADNKIGLDETELAAELDSAIGDFATTRRKLSGK